MMQKTFNFIIVLIVIGLVVDRVFSVEKMSNAKKSQADFEAIRNLSDLANQLTKNGKLVIPGGLEIKGDLKVNKKITSKTLEVSHDSDFGTSSNRKMSIAPSSYRNDGTMFAFFNGKKRTFYMIPRITGQLYNSGSLNCEGDVTGTNIIVRKDVKANGDINGTNVNIKKDVKASGNGYFGPAYIGKYGKTQ